MSSEISTIQMYTGLTQDAAATIDIPDDGFITSLVLRVEGLLNADAEKVKASVEFGSVNTFDVNDTRSMIAALICRFGLLTSGAAEAAKSQLFIFGNPGIKVFGGERLYLHTAATGGSLITAHANIVFSFSKFIARRR